jgi:2-isopropylmalate synthase
MWAVEVPKAGKGSNINAYPLSQRQHEPWNDLQGFFHFRRGASMSRIQIYDTTLRDGSQGEGVNFSLQDKLLITRRLDELGVDFIEGGYPLSNPKDVEYFKEVRKLSLKHAKICAFGMTRRKNCDPKDDICLRALIDAQTPVITIVGKTWDMHVREVLGTTLEENRHDPRFGRLVQSQNREVI